MRAKVGERSARTGGSRHQKRTRSVEKDAENGTAGLTATATAAATAAAVRSVRSPALGSDSRQERATRNESVAGRRRQNGSLRIAEIGRQLQDARTPQEVRAPSDVHSMIDAILTNICRFQSGGGGSVSATATAAAAAAERRPVAPRPARPVRRRLAATGWRRRSAAAGRDGPRAAAGRDAARQTRPPVARPQNGTVGTSPLPFDVEMLTIDDVHRKGTRFSRLDIVQRSVF